MLHDAEGSNVYSDYIDFRFIEKDEVLDSLECFDIVANKVYTHIEEKVSKAEKEKLTFDAFSMLEFMKVRRKVNNFLFGLASLLEIYRLQVASIGGGFQTKFEEEIDITSVADAANKKNYLKLLLDVSSIKIGKDILSLENWIPLMIKSQNLIQLTQYLESLILCS